VVLQLENQLEVVKVLGLGHRHLKLNLILQLLPLTLPQRPLHHLLVALLLVGDTKQKLDKEFLHDGLQEKLKDKKDALQEELPVLVLGVIKNSDEMKQKRTLNKL